MRQPIDQVDIQALEAQLARRENQIARHFVRLNPMNRFLDARLEILNPHAEPVEPEVPKRFQMLATGHSRIDFDSDLRIRSKREALARIAEEIVHLFRSKVRGRAAAPVELNHGPPLRNLSADVIDFALQRIEVRNRDVLVLLNRDVARAEQAQALAEGYVHVERNGRAALVSGRERLFEIVRTEIILPNGRRGVTRVARAGPVVLFEERVRDLIYAHFL